MGGRSTRQWDRVWRARAGRTGGVLLVAQCELTRPNLEPRVNGWVTHGNAQRTKGEAKHWYRIVAGQIMYDTETEKLTDHVRLTDTINRA
jgi:hypothetical protein